MIGGPAIATVFGVDFSGARLAGKNTWVARFDVEPTRLRLRSLDSLESLAGTAERGPALAWLTDAIASSNDALWGIDAPLGLPVELFDDGTSWRRILDFVCQFNGDAIALGRHLVERSRAFTGAMHVRRVTDREEKTPFDCYHYRIVHQTCHAMRDVATPLAREPHVRIAPFDDADDETRVVLVEACPSSTLRRLELPRRGYKQTTRGPVDAARTEVRERILGGIRRHASFGQRHRRVMLENPGGDAIDAVLAGVGAFAAWRRGDWRERALREPRIAREGWVFA